MGNQKGKQRRKDRTHEFQNENCFLGDQNTGSLLPKYGQ